MIARLSIATLALATMACTTMTPEEGEPPLMGAGDCNADSARSLVGQQATAELGADALRRTGARTIRWIRPGDAVTMDYRTDRLNIELDGNGRVARFTCG